MLEFQWFHDSAESGIRKTRSGKGRLPLTVVGARRGESDTDREQQQTRHRSGPSKMDDSIVMEANCGEDGFP